MFAPHIAAWDMNRRKLARGGMPMIAHVHPVVRNGHLVRMEWRGPPIQRADPFTIGAAIITALEVVSGVAIGFEVASFVGAVVIGGAAIGANLLLAAGAADGTGEISNPGAAVNAQEVRQNRRQATPHKKIIYGRSLTGGDMWFEAEAAPYLYHGWMYCCREIEGFEQVRIGTDVVAIHTTSALLPVNQILTPQGNYVDGAITATPDYATNLRISLRTGSSSQLIDPLLDADFAALDANFRERGVATAVLRYRWPGSTYDTRQAMWGDGQAPNPQFLIKGVRVYDPRDPTQSRDTESTWKWSENAALIQADYLRADYGGRIDPEDIDWDTVRDAADYDDELVGTTTAGEFIRRHVINGVLTLNQSPNTVLSGLLSANRGFVPEMAGAFWITSSKPKQSILTIDDSMLCGDVQFQGAKPKRDLINRERSRFIAAERDYQQVDGPIYDRPDLQATDGEILSSTLTLAFTPDHRRVQRLQKAHLQTGRLGKQLTVRIKLSALADADDELTMAAVTFDSVLFAPANGLYRVQTVGFAENFASMELQLSEYDPDIESDWNPSVDEQPFEIADLDVT